MAKRKRCQTCVTRHGRCDGSKPVCQRCQEAGQKCVWKIETRPAIMFMEENVHADGTKRRIKGPPRRNLDETTTNSFAVQSLQPGFTPNIPNALSIGVAKYAQAKYMHNFLRLAHGMESALEGFLVQYGMPKSSTEQISLSQLSMSAVMLVSFGISEKSSLAYSLSRRAYQRALLATSKAMSNRVSAPDDDLLVAVMLLGCYEGHTGDRLDQSSLPNTFLHVQGATSLLQARLSCGTMSRQSHALDTIVWRRAARIAVQTGSHLNPIIQDCIDQQDCQETNVKLIYSLMAELADLNADFQHYSRSWSETKHSQHYRSILTRALELNSKTSSIGDALSASDCYRRQSISLLSSKDGALRSILQAYYSCVTYPSVHAAHETTVFFGCCIRIQDIILSCMSKLTEKSDPFSCAGDVFCAKIKNTMDELVSDVFASTPYLLGDLNSPGKTIDDVCRNANGAHCGQIVFALHSIVTARNVAPEPRKIAAHLLALASRPAANGILAAFVTALGVVNSQP